MKSNVTTTCKIVLVAKMVDFNFIAQLSKFSLESLLNDGFQFII